MTMAIQAAMQRRVRRAIALLAASGVSIVATAAYALEANEIFKLADPSIVVVVASSSRTGQALFGTGVLIGDRDAVTTCNLVREAGKIVVGQGGVLRATELRFQDLPRDLCQVRMEEPFPKGRPVAAPVASKDLELGQAVFAISAPQGLDHTITRGIVSGLRQSPGETGRLIQIDAAVSKGAGGGLFDSQGRLIGIITFPLKDAQDLNFAAPTEWIAELAQRHGKIPEGAGEAFAANRTQAVPAPAVGAASNNPASVKVGDRWIYRLSDRGRTLRNVTVEIAEIDGSRVRERVTVQGFNGYNAERDVETKFDPVRFVSPAVLPGGYQLAEMAPYFPADTKLNPGQTWKQLPSDFSVQPKGIQSLLSDARVVRRERVVVPAGSFDAWRIETVSSPVNYYGSLMTVKGIYWYSPGMLRTVKMTVIVESYLMGSGGVESYELVSYQPGR